MATRESSLDLPIFLWEDIMNRLEDARDIAKAQLLSRDCFAAGNNVRSLRICCRDGYHELARRDAIDVASLRSGILPAGKSHEAGQSSSSQDMHGGLIRRSLSFREQVVKILERMNYITQLRIEVESKLQSKIVPEGERRRTDFWFTDPWFSTQWLTPRMGSTLQHLCIVDYGQQAIMRRSSIIRMLSENCKLLKTLDLSNMFIDTSDCKQMPSMVSLTLRSVKVVGEALQHINDKMPMLQTLALLGVFGVERGNLAFQDMKVLCLGLSTPACDDVVMELPKLEKLQLKMQCPEKLIIRASLLRYVAYNLNGLGRRACQEGNGLIRILHGAPSFITLSSYAEKNQNIDRIFLNSPCTALVEDGRRLGKLEEVSNEILDIACLGDMTLDVPCMRLLKDGRYLDVLNDDPVNIPSFSILHECGYPEASDTPRGFWSQGEFPDGLILEVSAAGRA